MPFDITIPSSSEATNYLWTGTNYLVLVSSNTSMHPGDNVIQLFGNDGTPGAIFATIPKAAGTLFFTQSFVWSGTMLGLVVTPNPSYQGSLALSRLDASGNLIGTTSLTSLGSEARVAWAGDRFVVVWMSQQSTLNLVEITPDGVPGMVQVFTSPTPPNYFNGIGTLAVSTTTYAVMASQYATQTAILVDRGTLQVAYASLDNGLGYIAARGNEFGVFENQSGWFRKIDASGIVGPQVQTQYAPRGAEIVATGSGYRVSGISGTMSDDYAYLDLDPDGVLQGALTPLGSNPPSAINLDGQTISTSDRYAFYIAYGPAGAPPHIETQRLIQLCIP